MKIKIWKRIKCNICQVSFCNLFQFVVFAMCKRVRSIFFGGTSIFSFYQFSSIQFNCFQSIEFIISFMLLNKFVHHFFSSVCIPITRYCVRARVLKTYIRCRSCMMVNLFNPLSLLCMMNVRVLYCFLFTDMCNRKPIHQLICVLESIRALYWLAFWANDNGTSHWIYFDMDLSFSFVEVVGLFLNFSSIYYFACARVWESERGKQIYCFDFVSVPQAIRCVLKRCWISK